MLIDTADIPGGGQLRLLQYGGNFSIEFGFEELMGSCDHVSEEALAKLTCERLSNRDGDVLIGGLGMGFTLGAALAAWSPRSSITVVELVPKILTWAKGPLAHIFRDHLADPRVIIEIDDVHDVIANSKDRFDAILLDVDNGPDGLIQLENERLYSGWGLRSAHTALRCGGILAIWSAYPAADFDRRLEAVGFVVETLEIPAFIGSNDDVHHIWFATKQTE
ncbi:spermidine synthase [Sphingobium sp. BYY-5]|uniref:spermidine synthase n=1 Tax=Sphingobium sp. BYY-5 TaxID=2926400 RepID=UPI00325BE08D